MAWLLTLLSAPAANDRTPRHMEKAIAAVHQGLRVGDRLGLEIGVTKGRVGFFIRGADALERLALDPLIASYPQVSVTGVSDADDPLLCHPLGWSTMRCELALAPELFPILRHSQFEDMLQRSIADPLDTVLRSVMPTADSEGHISATVTPASRRRQHQARRAVEDLERSLFANRPRLAEWYASHCLQPGGAWLTWPLTILARASPPQDRSPSLDVSAGARHEREADLQAAADKVGGHLFQARLVLTAWGTNKEAAQDRLRLMTSALGAFTRSRLATFSATRRTGGFILNQEELATLWHFPMAGAGIEQLNVASFRELEPPPVFQTGSEPGAVTLGRVRFRDDARPVGIALDDRRRHLYVIGRSGTGKTTLLLNLIHADLASRRGLALIDPHGDLADAVLALVPQFRTNDVIVLDPGDSEYAVGFNPLACPNPSRVDQVAGGVVAAFKKLHDSWGPRLEDTLRNAVFAIVEQQGTMLSLLRLLSDAQYRERLVPGIRDPVVRLFWQREFSSWSKAYRTEAVAAVQNKVRPFLTSPTMRAIVCQSSKTLNLRAVMDEGKILIVNLSKGRIGEDNSALLGALLVTNIQQAAMIRADVPEENRTDFHLYIDEFQNFATGSFATLLSEARKFHVSCTLSHQFLGQLDETVAAALAGNVGSMVVFAVGGEDAETLILSMSREPEQLLSWDLTNLPRHTACVRLLVNGTPSAPFTINTFPPPSVLQDRSAIVRLSSRRRHARLAADVLRELEVQLAS